jgi:hypothetical protein
MALGDGVRRVVDSLRARRTLSQSVSTRTGRAWTSEIGGYLAALRGQGSQTEIVLWERFRHHVSMTGKLINCIAMTGARKRGSS